MIIFVYLVGSLVGEINIIKIWSQRESARSMSLYLLRKSLPTTDCLAWSSSKQSPSVVINADYFGNTLSMTWLLRLAT